MHQICTRLPHALPRANADRRLNPMIVTPSPAFDIDAFYCMKLLRRWRSAAVCRCLATGVLLSTSLLASHTAWADPMDAAREVALHQQPKMSAPTEIRMKLHGIERLGIDPEPALPALDSEESAADVDADEVKKQAVARYLATKLKKQEATVRKYVDLAWAEADKRELLAPELLIAIIQKESAFRPKVQSRYGAQGLMQVVHRWHREKLQPSESLFDPEVNIRVGADVLEEYLSLAGGNLDHALRRYSGNAQGYASTILKESRMLARIAEQAATRTRVAQG